MPNQEITVTLTLEERRFLCDTVRFAIMQGLQGEGRRDSTLPIPPQGVLHRHAGCFVTLHTVRPEMPFELPQRHLRGCIGSMSAHEALYRNVAHMAYAAAFEDPRFPPLTFEEWTDVDFEISVLGSLLLCSDPEKIEVGRHGLLLTLGNKSGVFLPQVPVEQGWDRAAYLEHLCCKANLPPESWCAKGAQLFCFECLVFQPESA